jgi:fermentation-respiration switch protein FrsA (DUF1100 family)
MSEEKPAEPPTPAAPAGLWPRVRRILIRWTLILTGLYLVLVVLGYFLQAKLIFYPHKHLETDPRKHGMAFEDVKLLSDDGTELHAWWVPALGRSRGAVVFCHGNAGNISHRIDSLRIFRNMGLDTLIFDYRGYGRSKGSPSEDGFYRDADAAWRHVTLARAVKPERVLIFGRSLGGSVAAHLAAEHTPRALVLESAFSSIPDMGAEHYPLIPRFLARYDFVTVEYVRGVKCPVLSVHSPQDEIVPFEQGKRVHQAAPDPKKFLEISGDHNNGFMLSAEKYTRGLGNFIDRYFPPAPGPGGAAPRPSALPAPRAARGFKVVHVFVPLCDNKNQGIVKVVAPLGNGQNPNTNLYWGARYGVRTFFSRSDRWEKLKGVARPANAAILERVAFRGRFGGKQVYLLADAYDGARMREALDEFLSAAAGRSPEQVRLGGRKLSVAGSADMVAFCGHNGLMDLRLDSFPKRGGGSGPECAVVLACKSRDYFLTALKSAGCRPLVTTTGFMAPEAYTLDAAVRSWAAGETPEAVRRKAAAAYAKYQRCPRRAAEKLFAGGGNQ